jgi:DNA primase
MRIPPHIVDEIYRRADILEVVSDYVQLKRKGAYYVGISPFKQERTPSFTVTPSKGIFKCFSTGKGGTVVNFLMEMEGLTYREALVKLAERYRIELDFLDESNQAEERDRSESLYILNEFAADWYQQQLWETEAGQLEGLQYLRRRGLTDETIRAWQLGYSPEGWDVFTKQALAKKFTDEALLETGLSFRSEKSGQLLDRYRSRLMFPIRNSWGKLAGFGARQLKAEDRGGKYINSRDSLIYNKSQLLYGLHTAREQIRHHEQLILVEGYLDVLALHQAGYGRAVASCGTAVTAEQLQPVRRICREVVLLYDGDEAGVAATAKAAEIALSTGFEVQVLTLPEGHDPDSFLRDAGEAAFAEQWSSKRQPLLTWLLAGLDDEGPSERAARVQSAARLLSAIPDPLTRSVYIQEFARISQLPEAIIHQAANADLAVQQNLHSPTSPHHLTKQGLPRPLVISPRKSTWFSERELLRLLLNYHSERVKPINDRLESEPDDSQLLGYALRQHLADLQFADETHEAIRNIMLANLDLDGRPRLSIAALVGEANASVQQAVSELLSHKHVLSPRFEAESILVPNMDADLQRAFEEAICYYALKRITELEAENLREIRAAEAQGSSDISLLNKLLNRHRLLAQKRRLFTERKGIVVWSGAK